MQIGDVCGLEGINYPVQDAAAGDRVELERNAEVFRKARLQHKDQRGDGKIGEGVKVYRDGRGYAGHGSGEVDSQCGDSLRPGGDCG